MFFFPKNQKIYFSIWWKKYKHNCFVHLYTKQMSYSIRKIDSESQLASIQFYLNLRFFSKFLYRLIPSIDARWNFDKNFLMLRTILVDILYYARIPLLSCLPHTAINFDFFNGTWTWSTKTIIPYKTCAKTSEVFVFFVNIYMNFIDKERKRQWERESMCIRSDVFQKSIKIIFIYL